MFHRKEDTRDDIIEDLNEQIADRERSADYWYHKFLDKSTELERTVLQYNQRIDESESRADQWMEAWYGKSKQFIGATHKISELKANPQFIDEWYQPYISLAERYSRLSSENKELKNRIERLATLIDQMQS